MQILIKIIDLMDSTIIAILGVPALAVFLVGSLMLAMVGLFLMLKEAAAGRKRKN